MLGSYAAAGIGPRSNRHEHFIGRNSHPKTSVCDVSLMMREAAIPPPPRPPVASRVLAPRQGKSLDHGPTRLLLSRVTLGHERARMDGKRAALSRGQSICGGKRQYR